MTKLTWLVEKYRVKEQVEDLPTDDEKDATTGNEGGSTPISEAEVVEDKPKEKTYAEKITKAMSRLDFTVPAAELDRTVRAVTGYAVFGGKRFKLLRTVLDTGKRSDAPAGTLLREGKHELYVVCGDGGCVRLLTVQPEGSRPMQIPDFLNGCRLNGGECLTAAEEAL